MGLLFLNSIYNIIVLIDNLIRDLIGLAFEKNHRRMSLKTTKVKFLTFLYGLLTQESQQRFNKEMKQ
uniref:Uncharacterized protein n=1 Tax=Anguilla anguilla TaxID=7936 RepID=A0A0E9X4L8_ANGAN